MIENRAVMLRFFDDLVDTDGLLKFRTINGLVNLLGEVSVNFASCEEKLRIQSRNSTKSCKRCEPISVMNTSLHTSGLVLQSSL
jgi:hypothetical protein